MKRLADRWQAVNIEKRKLIYSLTTNFMTRVPGAIGVLWFLPLLRFGLGTDQYADLLSAIALGIAAGFLLGGFGVVGRRLIGEAYAANDHTGEADAFVSTMIASSLALGVSLAIVLIYCVWRQTSLGFLIVALVPAIGLFLNIFDNVRSAYNEHYITAIIVTLSQIAIYAIGFLVPAARHNFILGAMILQVHYLIASLITCVLVLRGRSYLLRGRACHVWAIIRDGVMMSFADGFLMATLSLSVVWLQAAAVPATSAWFATIVRLFQTLLTPVILVLLPLSSYIRILWQGKSAAQQRAFTKLTLFIGMLYGAFVAVLLFIASFFYANKLLHLEAPGTFLMVCPVFLLFGAIVAYRGYSSIAYIVLNETAHLSLWTAAAVGIGVLLGAITSLSAAPFDVINVYAVVAGFSILGVMVWNASRFLRFSPQV